MLCWAMYTLQPYWAGGGAPAVVTVSLGTLSTYLVELVVYIGQQLRLLQVGSAGGCCSDLAAVALGMVSDCF